MYISSNYQCLHCDILLHKNVYCILYNFSSVMGFHELDCYSIRCVMFMMLKNDGGDDDDHDDSQDVCTYVCNVSGLL